ncbi:MAG: hypothetical protein EOS00_11130, partial [Mesorhizobium sp.]
YSLFTIHYSLFTIHYSLFTIHYSLFTIHTSQLLRTPMGRPMAGFGNVHCRLTRFFSRYMVRR